MSTDLQLNQNLPAARGELSVSASSAAAIAEVQAAYVMAMQNPRNIFEARNRMFEACERQAFAKKARYHRPVGKDKYGNQTFADGFSVHFARPAAVMMRNILINTGVLYEDDKIRKVVARATDIEANVAYTKEGIVEKTIEKRSAKGREVISERTNSYGDQTYLVVAYPHEVDLKAAKLTAILLRDCVLPLIPPDILEEIEEKIIDVVASEMTNDPITARKKMVDAFRLIGVSSKQLVEYLKHPIEELTPREYADLQAAYATIKDGTAVWSDYVDGSDKKPIQTSTISVADLKPAPPEEHTDVREPIKQPSGGGKMGACEQYWITTIDGLQSKYSLTENAMKRIAAICEESSINPAIMPDRSKKALESWVWGTLVPALQEEDWLPEGEITL